MYKIKSNAKINIGLEVCGRRSDGYHDIRTIMQEITLSDVICAEPSEKTIISCNFKYIPTDERNLVHKALSAFRAYTGVAANMTVHIQKRIPIQAGLGGGSSNAACILRLCDRVYGTHLSVNDLRTIASGIGADVPFFIGGGTSLCEGIGDRLTPIDTTGFPKYYVMLIKPRFSVSTPAAFEAIDSAGITRKADFSAILSGLASASSTMLKRGMVNTFEEYAQERYPQIEECRNILRFAGAIATQMTGSGSVIYGIFERKPSLGSVLESYRSDTYIEEFVYRSVEE